MDERFQAILDSLPPKPPRSRLEPYWELIQELRRRGRTYRDIAQVLAENCQVTVAPSTIHDFVRVRTPRKKTKPPVMPAEPRSAPDHSSTATEPETDGSATEKSDAETLRLRIEALKQRQVVPGESKPVFEYNSEEPLRLIPKSSESK